MNIDSRFQRETPQNMREVSLIRSTPPTPPWMDQELEKSLRHIVTTPSYQNILRSHTFHGSKADREVAADWLGKRLGSRPNPDRVIITNGTQNAMYIALRSVCGTNGTLLTESISYYGLRRIASMLNVDVKAIEIDEDGASPQEFVDRCVQFNPGAVFLQPTLHNPTSITMSTPRRSELAEIARRKRVAIIEDDVYGVLPSDAPAPIAAIAPDITWYATGPAKCMGPGLRIGYLVAPTPQDAARAIKSFETISTWHASPLSSAIMADWIRRGVLDRILLAVREEIAIRQTIAKRILEPWIASTHHESVYQWLRMPRGVSADRVLEISKSKGILLRPGDMFFVNPKTTTDCFRVVIGSPENRNDLEHALLMLSATIASQVSP
ncbi:PLP-dependent aminotransferase family protein [Sinorhizobium meliloti]|uniref:aminotransferase-like domain-containing protein n=1 Tax=Rhizobium meliloti TaxID=382 RepID=UPI0002D2DD7F|nr:PLP-dependent aminotransferase family protein [Sinorhizobium meliloti]MDE4604558.1 PLP-dependent aminotransferase family protein [Sinorhizobium meliloti]UDU21119.1 PLP-dependent aminotransferase family protein [Sinorhizobium meliloti]